MQVKVNEDCIGCGVCESICPEVFRLENDLSQVVGNPDENSSAVAEAAGACPVNAIEVDD